MNSEEQYCCTASKLRTRLEQIVSVKKEKYEPQVERPGFTQVLKEYLKRRNSLQSVIAKQTR